MVRAWCVPPIEWGGRFTGRVGGWNVGVLNVQADSVNEPGHSIAETGFTVARVNRNIGRRSTIGAIFTDRDEEGRASSRVLGIDLNYKPDAHSEFFLYGARSDDPDVEGDEASWGGGYFYSSRDIQASVDLVEVQQNFRPEVGFLLRSDFTRYNPRIRWTPPINRFGQRNIFFEAVLDYFERSSTGLLESRKIQLAPIGARTRGEHLWRLAWVDETEQLFEPFEIRPGIVIQPGLYRAQALDRGLDRAPRRVLRLRRPRDEPDPCGGDSDLERRLLGAGAAPSRAAL